MELKNIKPAIRQKILIALFTGVMVGLLLDVLTQYFPLFIYYTPVSFGLITYLYLLIKLGRSSLSE